MTELTHSAHWGVFTARREDGRLRVRPHTGDPDPSPVLDNIPDALDHPARVLFPAVRRGWWENGPGAGRSPRHRLLHPRRLGRGAGPAGRRAAPGPHRARRRRRLRRELRLGQRRALPPRPGPAAPLPGRHRRLHALGQHLLRRRGRGDPPARARRVRRRHPLLGQLGPGGHPHRHGARVRRDGAEELHGRRRRGQPARRARGDALRPRPRHPVRAGRSAASGPARRRRRAVAADRARHGHGADAGADARGGRGRPARHRVPGDRTAPAGRPSSPTCGTRTPSGPPGSPASTPRRSGSWPRGSPPAGRW